MKTSENEYTMETLAALAGKVIAKKMEFLIFKVLTCL